MTAAQSLEVLGRYSQGATLSTDGLSVAVTVQDVRQVWGRTDLLVSPVAGSGQIWVSQDRVSQ